ncbi:MAG: type II secretion system protein M [Polyangiaceae bacterium]|nr:type II secretion system protein M [Polyangiaceae bacterium]
MVIPIFERWGLSPREQRVATIAVFVAGVMLLSAIPLGLSMLVSSRRAANEEIRTALTAVNGARAQIRERQERKNSIAARYQKKAPPLAGFLEQNATANKLQVTDSADHPDVPHGKRYTERNTVIHLKRAGMLPIAKFLESIAKSGYPVAATRLNIRKRSGEADSFDVEVGLSAFDRNEMPSDKSGDQPGAPATPPAEKKP